VSKCRFWLPKIHSCEDDAKIHYQIIDQAAHEGALHAPSWAA
jgi:hypothetical protein